MKFGMDYLFGAAFPKVIYNGHPKGWAVGFFHGVYRTTKDKLETFPPPLKVIEGLICRELCDHFRIQLLWDDGHLFGPKDFPLIRKLIKPYAALSEQYPHIRFQLSPFCEHNLAQLDSFFTSLKPLVGRCELVNSVYRGNPVKGVLTEVHSNSKPPKGPYQYSFDGENAFLSDVKAKLKEHKDAETFFLWCPAFNRKESVTDKTPRRERTIKPTAKQIKSLAELVK